MATASARDQGLFVEALALKLATADAGDVDLSTRAQKLYDDVSNAATSTIDAYKLYAPSWLGGGFGDEADSIAAAFKARHGFDPLDQKTTVPTDGPAATVEGLASGQPGRALDAGANGLNPLGPLGDWWSHYGKWIGFALVALVLAFLALESAKLVRAVKG